METVKEKKNRFRPVASVVSSLAEKYGCTRQYVGKVITGESECNSIRAHKILADARDIEAIIERETIITI